MGKAIDDLEDETGSRTCVDCQETMSLGNGLEWPGDPEDTRCWECLDKRLTKIEEAIRRYGLAICQTSGDWSLHDVTQAGEAEAARTLEVANENVDLTVENHQLTQRVTELTVEIARLKSQLARFQESEFHPDWSLLKASRDSNREMRQMLLKLKSLFEKLGEQIDAELRKEDTLLTDSLRTVCQFVQKAVRAAKLIDS